MKTTACAQVRQHAEKLAAPIAAAQEAEAKKLADKRAQLAAVEPRQRSTRGSAAQAKKALSKQAKVSYTDIGHGAFSMSLGLKHPS